MGPFNCSFGLKPYRFVIFLLVLCVFAAGCNWHQQSQKPSVEITLVPPANPGGPGSLDYIGGRVTNAAHGQKIVIYARSEIWWIQPFSNSPFTNIQPDSTWKNSTHLGTEYAALLVDQGYSPQPRLQTLPAVGKGVAAIATINGTASAPIVSKTIHFSGYDWLVRTASSDRGGGVNQYDPANAWVDKNGYLHMKMTEHDGQWYCAEISMTRSLGFGTYKVVVQDMGHLGPAAVVSMFTWNDMETQANPSDLDIELSRWGNPDSKNAQYVVQPYYVPQNVYRFNVPAGVHTYILHWAPGMASFKTVSGTGETANAKPTSEHDFTSGIPSPAGKTVHLDLYDYHHSKIAYQRPAEVVIEKFEYLP